MKHFRVDSNGQSINVTDWGGQGRTLLFSHPTGFLGAVWKPVIDELRGIGFDGRVLSIDHRGHGLSSKPDDGYQWSNFVDDLEGVMARLELEAALGVGHSGGATTLAGVAAADGKRFERLLLIDPILFDPVVDASFAEVDNPMSARTRTRRMVWPSREYLYEVFASKPPYDTWTEAALRAYVEHGSFDRPDGEIELLCPARLEARVYQRAAESDGFAYLEALDLPVLVVKGETTDSFTDERAERAMDRLPQGRLLVVPGSTHFVPMEFPRVIADLIAEELADSGA